MQNVLQNILSLPEVKPEPSFRESRPLIANIANIPIILLPVPWSCDYEKWVATVRIYVPLGPHGRANLEKLIKRARQKDDARELQEFFEGAALYVLRRKESADFLGLIR